MAPVVMRALLLRAAESQRLRDVVVKHGRRFGAYRFVAGESLDEFMQAVRAANSDGMRVAAGLLGEDVHSPEAADAVAAEYRAILQRFAEERATANVALKLTHLGLAIDREHARSLLVSVATRARELGNFVRVDMEQSAYTDDTLSLYRQMRADGFDNVGTVLQAYLYRTDGDLRSLLELRPNLRLVKGAYLESAAIAFPKKTDVDANYARLIESSLLGGGFTAIATHDDAIIDHAIAFIRDRRVPDGTYEFQMLFGVRPRLQQRILRLGLPLRLAIPFGAEWFPYFMRRLAERPANVLFFIGSLWRG